MVTNGKKAAADAEGFSIFIPQRFTASGESW
jgi:hypothetical protein